MAKMGLYSETQNLCRFEQEAELETLSITVNTTKVFIPIEASTAIKNLRRYREMEYHSMIVSNDTIIGEAGNAVKFI